MTRDEAEKIVTSMLEKNVKGLKISKGQMDKTLVDLGIDSLDVMLVIMDIGEASGVTISDDDAEQLNTPAKLVEFILQ